MSRFAGWFVPPRLHPPPKPPQLSLLDVLCWRLAGLCGWRLMLTLTPLQESRNMLNERCSPVLLFGLTPAIVTAILHLFIQVRGYFDSAPLGDYQHERP
jgi:hypothetical protein